MTSSAITEIAKISYPGSGSQSPKSASGSSDEAAGSFQAAMNLAEGNSREELTKPSAPLKTSSPDFMQNSTGRVQQTENIKKTENQAVTGQESTKESGETKEADAMEGTQRTEDTAVEETEDTDVLEAVEKKAEELEAEIVKLVADALGVSKEDVEKAMEALGLTFMDLSNQADMAALATLLRADGDSTAMLTDETLFTDVVELTGQITELIATEVKELSDEVSADFSEIMDMMTETAANQQTIPDEVQLKIPEQSTASGLTDMTHEEVSHEYGSKAEAVQPQQSPDLQSIQELTQPVKQTYEQSYEQSGEQPEEKSNGQTVEAGTLQLQGEQAEEENADSGQENMLQHKDTGFVFSAQEVQTARMTATVTGTEPEVYAKQIDVQDIIDQIARYVRVQNTPEISEVELSLHPASLGNVHLQVTATEGVITARIAAENEAVKDALMVQAMVLKEELSGQGLKIDAVEVTVASHEFEQNMQGESGENAEQMYEEQVKKDTRRRIMLSGLEEAEELLADDNLTDAERIRIEMMAKSGSSMDMLA